MQFLVRLSSVSCWVLLLFTSAALADTRSELIEAATDGQTETLKALIGDSADIQSDGGTALISAAFSALQRYENGESNEGQIEAIKVLVDAGADVDIRFDNGITALMLMSILGNTEMVIALLEAGADVNATNNADGGSALIFAVYGGSTEIVLVLIDAGADINVADAGTGTEDGRTALYYAEEKNHAEITEVLTQAGAE
jgi:ankyrin repeat protein